MGARSAPDPESNPAAAELLPGLTPGGFDVLRQVRRASDGAFRRTSKRSIFARALVLGGRSAGLYDAARADGRPGLKARSEAERPQARVMMLPFPVRVRACGKSAFSELRFPPPSYSRTARQRGLPDGPRGRADPATSRFPARAHQPRPRTVQHADN
jgi:hypothetical protein